MSNPSTQSRPAGQLNTNANPANIPIISSSAPSSNADNVAESVRTAAQPVAQSERQHQSIPTAPVKIGEVQVHRDAVKINYYEARPWSEVRRENVRNEHGELKPIDVVHEGTQVYMCQELAYINNDGTATLVDGSIADIPHGPGKDGCYDRPGFARGASRTIPNG